MDELTTLDAVRGYIGRVRWQFARTMPQWPHEYTVRSWTPRLESHFEAFVHLIREQGDVRCWPRDSASPKYRHTYWELDGWQYWTMGAPVGRTTVLNRAMVGGPGAA